MWLGGGSSCGWLGRQLSPGESGLRGSKQALVLLLLEAQPVGGADVRWAGRLGGQPLLDRRAHLWIPLEPQREAHLAEVKPLLVQQFAQGAQALQLGGSVEPISGARAAWLDKPDALYVAQHARRPAGRLGRLVDCQRSNGRSLHCPDLITTMSRLRRLWAERGKRLMAHPPAKCALHMSDRGRSTAPRPQPSQLTRSALSCSISFTGPGSTPRKTAR